MKKKLLVGIVAAAMSFSMLAGCGGEKAGDTDVIKIGSNGPLSGEAATYGISVREGAQLVEKEINDAGGINGKKIQFIFEDDQADPNSAKQAFNKLVEKDKVVAILGGVTSGATLAIAPDSTAKKIPMITPTGTEPTITNLGGEYMFRGCFVDSFQGEVLGKYAAKDLGKKTAAVLYNSGTDYSTGIAKAFKAEFEANGGKVVDFATYNDGDNDFRAQLTKIKQSKPDVVVLPDYYTVVGLIAKQARDMGIEAQFLGGDGWDSDKLSEIGGEAVNGAKYVNHYYSEDENPLVKNFVDSYKKAYNGKKPDAFAALSYDTSKVLVQAIKDAGSTDPEKIKDALKKVELESVTGKIRFNEERSAVKSAVIIKVENGKNVLDTKVDTK